jgi:heptosyltransferase-1
MAMAEERFAVVRLGSLGDIVHTFPAMAGLRESFPATPIVWVTHPRWVKLVESSGLATETWPVDSRDLSSVRRVVAKLRAFQPAASIDFQGLWKSAIPPFLAGIRRRIGFSSSTIREFGVPILYTERVECRTTHIADQNGELSLQAGSRQAVGAVALRISPADENFAQQQLREQCIDGYVVLSPGGGWGSKCWPADRFGALCQLLRTELGLRCVINYGPGEEALFDGVKATSGNTEPVPCDGELGRLMAVLKSARCAVGGDTGPLHLAVALHTPIVALFGPTDPARNGPYPRQEIVLRSPKAITSHRRGESSDASLLELSVVEVFAAVKRRLGVAA